MLHIYIGRTMTINFSISSACKLYISVNCFGSVMRTVVYFYYDCEKTITSIFKFRQYVLDNDYLNSPLFSKSIFSYMVNGRFEITRVP